MLIKGVMEKLFFYLSLAIHKYTYTSISVQMEKLIKYFKNLSGFHFKSDFLHTLY